MRSLLLIAAVASLGCPASFPRPATHSTRVQSASIPVTVPTNAQAVASHVPVPAASSAATVPPADIPTPVAAKPTQPSPPSTYVSWKQVLDRFDPLVDEKTASGKKAAEKSISRLPYGDKLLAEQTVAILERSGFPEQDSISRLMESGCQDFVRAFAANQVRNDVKWRTLAESIWSKRPALPASEKAVDAEAEWLFALSVAPGLCDYQSRLLLYSSVGDVLVGRSPLQIPDHVLPSYRRIIQEIP